MPSDQGPTDPRRDTRHRDDWDADDGLGPVHEQRPASDYYDDDPYDDYDDGPRLLARRLVQGGVALLAVVLFLGVVWYAYTWGSRSASTGDVPVVAAPEGAEKVEPEDPGGMDVPHQDKLVLNQDGEAENGQVERLLPPPEEPRPPENSQPETSPSAPTGESQPAEGTAPAESGDDGEQVAELPETTVPDQDMPDGEPGGDTAAGGEAGEAAASAEATDDAAQTGEAQTGEAQTGESQTGESRAGDGQADTGAETQTASAPTRTPERKPGGDGSDGAGQTETAAADPTQAADAPDAGPAGAPEDGRFAVQIAAFQSEQAARNAWASYQERFPEILTGQRLLLQNAEVDGQMYWRVRTGPFADRSAAQAVCDRLKARDQSCLPVTR
jgi:cell division septation protein DedD